MVAQDSSPNHRPWRGGGCTIAALKPLTVDQILAWADVHCENTGQWPTALDGTVGGARGETWLHVDGALSRGRRGLPGGSSLAMLLTKHRRIKGVRAARPLTLRQILDWADAHHQRTGKWPTTHAGEIPFAPGETWYRVQTALKRGRRGLPGGQTIAGILQEHCGVRSKAHLDPLTTRTILKWANAHKRTTGRWPTRLSGHVEGADGTTWMAIQDALYLGGRGLPGGTSLARLLQERRGVRNIHRLPDLSIDVILEWSDQHMNQTGRLPIRESGVIDGTAGENWGSVDHALKTGTRGLPGGTTLAQLLAEKRNKRNLRDLPQLTEKQILIWAHAHHDRTGRWPSQTAGPIVEAPGEKWRNVDTALYKGLRGLPGGSSLAMLLKDKKRSARTENRAAG